MAADIQVNRVAEEYQYLQQHPCTCGGSWGLQLQRAFPQPDGAMVDVLEVSCGACGRAESFRFRLAAKPRRPARDAPSPPVLSDPYERPSDPGDLPPQRPSPLRRVAVGTALALALLTLGWVFLARSGP